MTEIKTIMLYRTKLCRYNSGWTQVIAEVNKQDWYPATCLCEKVSEYTGRCWIHLQHKRALPTDLPVEINVNLSTSADGTFQYITYCKQMPDTKYTLYLITRLETALRQLKREDLLTNTDFLRQQIQAMTDS